MMTTDEAEIPATFDHIKQQAVIQLYNALLCLERDETHEAWNHCAAAQAWIRDLPEGGQLKAQTHSEPV